MDKKCETCTHPGRDCIPYLMTLSNAGLLDWARKRRIALHMSYEELSARSGIPMGTIEHMLGKKGTDCRFATAQPIIRVLSGCTDECLDCEWNEENHQALSDKLQSKDDIIRHLKDTVSMQHEEIGSLHETANHRMEKAKTEESETIKYLKRKEKGYIRIIIALSVALTIVLLLVIAALMIDNSNTSIGFFWTE